MTSPESLFTPTSAWCAHPERWSAPDGDSAECEVSELVAAFVRALKPEFVLETGSHLGHTAKAIADALAANGIGRLFTIERDVYLASQAAVRLTGSERWADIINAESFSWTPPIDVHFGFAFFDAGHRNRTLEFLRFRPWIETGAIVGFHDTGPQHPVRPEIEKLAADGRLRPIYLKTPRGVAFAEVLP